MGDILQKIMAHKRAETRARMRQTPFAKMCEQARQAPPPLPFVAALQNAARRPVIAEIKSRSPSKGVLCKNFNAAQLAKQYARGKAACLSVLTDEKFFGGATEHLRAAKAASGLPALRKDFIYNEWQIAEARAMGADAVLLIVAALPAQKIARLAAAARRWGMAVLIEAHTAGEAKLAAKIGGKHAETMTGINNRNLQTFVTDIKTSERLMPLARAQNPRAFVVAESGIAKRADVLRLQAAGANAFLIGESLMQNPAAGLARLFT